MKKRFSSPRPQVMASCVLVVILACLALTTSVFAAGPAPAQSAPNGPPKIWLGPNRPVQVTYSGAGAWPASGVLQGMTPQPVAMVQGDFDHDGVTDLAVGFGTGGGGFIAIHRGNLDAFAPQSDASFEAIGRGEFPEPFLPDAQTFAVPVRPDFIGAGDFTGNGNTDLAVASRGGSALYILPGDGKGGFGSPQAVNVSGAITSLAAGELGASAPWESLLVGLSNSKTVFSFLVLGNAGQGLKPIASYTLNAPVSNILFGDFADGGQDAAFLSGGRVMILRSASMRLSAISLPVSATAMALGRFVFDRNAGSQIALLLPDGSVQIAARSDFDPRTLTPDDVQALLKSGPRGLGRQNRVPANQTAALDNWKIIESFPGVATVTPGQAPLFFRTRISSNGADDIMWLGASSTQMVVISHRDTPPGAATFLPGEIAVKPYDGNAMAALPMRINIDGRSGIVALHQGQTTPFLSMPLPDPTFTVNRTDDPTPISPIANACNGVANDCSLREAILKANATAGTDTVMVPTGTYKLTIAKVANDCTGNFGALSVNDSINIVGAGQNTTIIEAGATAYNAGTPDGVDMVMNVNEDLATASCPITNATASLSNLTLQNGHNRGATGFDGDGGCMEFDTGSSGTASLTLTNVTLQNCDSPVGNGGGLAAFNFTNPGAGSVTITGSIIQGNQAVQPPTGGVAGGIWASVGSDPLNTPTHLELSNSQVLNNKAGVAGTGEGGAIWSRGVATPTQRTHIQSSTISGNQAGGMGGGIYTETGILIDNGTVISNNSGGLSNITNTRDGGGIFISLAPNQTIDISKVTITGNSSTQFGGGISVGDAPNQNINIHFSRIEGNTAPTGSNLFAHASQIDATHPLVAVVAATNNWWGTNAPASTINIEPNVISPPATQANVTFDPFIVLTHTASPNKIRINQSTTLTADMSKDNHGNGAALSGNLNEIVGIPITFNNAVDGSISGAQTSIQANGTATATFNAGSAAGGGKADAVVDQQTVTANIIVLQPPSITKSFSPTTIQTTGGTGPGSKTGTITFSINNPNVVTIESDFTDNLPTVGGPNPGSLVVASTPNVHNNGCGGSVTANAGAGSISFSNAALPIGACNITVDVQSAVDDLYSNSVTINSTDAGNGNTSSDTLNVINPPHITKSFGASTIPLNGTTSLTITVSSANQNQTLSGITFTDTLPNAAPGTLVVATPNGLTNNCSGTATASPGSGSVSLASSSLAPGASCTVSVNVTGTVAGAANNSVTGSDTTAGTGDTGTANLTVVAPPKISKSFGAASIPLNGSTSLSFTIQNNNTTVALSGVAFSDTLPAGLVISTPNGLTGSCGAGTITATQATNVISLSGGTIAASSSCTFSVNVTGVSAGQQDNTTGNVTSTEGGTGGTASASVKVEAPPSIAKAFNPTTIPLNATTSLTFTITNPAANVDQLTGVAFADTLPTGLTVANATATVCGGTLTTTAPAGIALSGATIAVNSQCQFPVTVTGAASGQYTNTTGNVTSTNGGTGNTASASLTVASPPTISKAFTATTIPLNGTTTVTFTINNPNSNVTLNGVAFTDNLPAGLVVAPAPNVSNTCSGTVTAVAGASSLSLSGGVVNQAASCTLSVDVQGTTAGTKLNTTGAISSTEGGTGTTSNTASLTVSQASTTTAVASSSNPSAFGVSVTFTATVTNTSGSTAAPTGSVQFVVDGVNFGSPVALAGASSTSSTATSQATATLSVSGSPHTVTANYVNADGNFTNSTGSLAGGQTITLAITNTAVASSSNPSVFGQSVTFTATVVDVSAGSTAQPTGAVQFVVDGVNFGSAVTLTGASSSSSAATSQATTTLTIVGSPHTVTANYVNADGNFTNSIGSLAGGQVVTQAGATTTVSSSLGTITLGDTETFTATVTANPPASGTPTGIVIFFDGSTPIGGGKLSGGQTTFPTSLLAVGSHSITAIYNGDANFAASPLSSPITETVNLRGSTTSVGLNPTTVAAGQASTTTVTVTDAGASTPPGTPDVFTATGAPATGRTGFTATFIADGAVVITGGTDANGVVLNSAEVYSGGSFSPVPGNLNTARTGAVAVLLGNGKVLIAGGSSNGGSNGALNSAELLDLNTGTFAPTSHNMTAARFGTTATLLNNGKVLIAGGANSGGVLNTAELYDPATDTFTATGNMNAARTGPSATLLGTGKVLVAGGSSDGTANGGLNSAELFDPAGNAGAGTFTSVAGANPTLATGRWQPEAALLLSGKVLVAGGQNSGGPLTTADLYDPAADSFTASAHQLNEARANGSAVALPSGMVLLAGGTTSQTVDLYDAEGDKFNTTGSLLHHNRGLVGLPLNNGQVLVVGLNIDNDPTDVSDAELYSPSFNPLGTVGFGSSEPTDGFGPACVLTPSSTTASTCSSTVTPIKVATSPHTITATYPADAVHSSSSNSASLTVIPTAPPTIAKAFSAANVAQNSKVNVNFTIVNPNAAATLTGISFTDSLPAGLVVATPNNLNSNCGGTFTAVAGSSSLSLTGGTVGPPGPPPVLPRKRQTAPLGPIASGQCVITVDLLVTGTGTLSNTTGAISSNEGGTGNPSNTATLQVVLAPTVNKAFGAASIPLNGTTSLTFNIANPNTTIGLDGVALSDTLPSGLVVATPNGLTGTCVASSSITANAGSNSISLSALNLTATASCSFSVNVKGTSGGTKNNTTAPITGTFDDGSGTFIPITGGTASASIAVVLPPSIAKTFNPAVIAPNGISTLTFTITNPAANTVAEAGVAFTDTLPTNVVVATPNGATGNCNGGTLTAVAGSGSINLTGGTVPVGGSCEVSVNVTSSVVGTYNNTSGAVSSTNGGTGNTASATLTVAPASLSITKTHSGNFQRGSTGNNYTITVSNAASAGPTAGTVTVVDTLPNVPNTLVPTAMSGSGWTCTLATVTCTRSDLLAPGASYPAITLTVTAPINIPANVTNSATVSGGGDPNSHTANDPTHIGPPIQITPPNPATMTLPRGQSGTMNFGVDSSPGIGAITFSCSGLPAGATCSFNPPSENQLSTTVTMTVNTSGPSSSSAAPLFRGGPTYALLFPALGLVGLVFIGNSGKKNRKIRLRWAMALSGLVLLLALAGCGGRPNFAGTPPGTYTITVTGSSGTTSGSAPVTLNVQ